MKKLFLTGVLSVALAGQSFGYVSVLADTNGGLKTPTNFFAGSIEQLTNALHGAGYPPAGGNAGTFLNTNLASGVVVTNGGAVWIGTNRPPFVGGLSTTNGYFTYVTNGGVITASLVLTNLSGTTTSSPAFFPNYDGLVVLPYTNLPASLTNSAKYFGPWLGADYVQQAVNALPVYADLTQCGGGKILVVGQNYLPYGLKLTNSTVMAFTFEAASYLTGCLISQTNPAIYVDNGEPGIPKLTLVLKNVCVASLLNTPDYLIQEESGVFHNEFNHCYFGPWEYCTNNYIFSTPIGIANSSTYPNLGGMTNNLAIKVQSLDGEKGFYVNNRCVGMVGWYVNDDHAQYDNNLFGACGNRNTGWSTSSPFWTGACFVIPNVNNEAIFYHTDYFLSAAAYYQMQSAGPVQGSAVACFSTFDKYETDDATIYHVGTPFEQLNPIALGGLHSFTVSGTSLIDDGDALGVKYTSGIGPSLTGLTTNLYFFNGATTNIGWFTNGLLCAVTPMAGGGGGGGSGLAGGDVLLTSNLVAYWNLDETSGVRADSVAANSLFESNTLGSVTGIISEAAAFDGSSWLELADASFLSVGTGDFAFSIWFSLNGSTNDAGSPTLLEAPDYTTGFLVRYNIASTGIQCFLAGNNHEFSAPITYGTTNHLVIIRDTGTLYLFLNGAFVSSAASPEDLSGLSGTGAVGQDNRLQADPWWGWIDEVGFWSRSLNTSEVSALFNSGAGKPFGTF